MDTQCCTEVAGLDRTWTYLCWFSGIFGKDSLANYQELIIPATHPAILRKMHQWNSWDFWCSGHGAAIFGIVRADDQSFRDGELLKAGCAWGGQRGGTQRLWYGTWRPQHIYIYIYIHIYMMWVKYVIHQPPVIAPSHHHVYRCKNPFLV